MWVVSKNKQKVVNASSISVENGNDIVVCSTGGDRYQMGNYATIDRCLQIIEDFRTALENGDNVFYLPKSKEDESILRGL